MGFPIGLDDLVEPRGELGVPIAVPAGQYATGAVPPENSSLQTAKLLRPRKARRSAFAGRTSHSSRCFAVLLVGSPHPGNDIVHVRRLLALFHLLHLDLFLPLVAGPGQNCLERGRAGPFSRRAVLFHPRPFRRRGSGKGLLRWVIALYEYRLPGDARKRQASSSPANPGHG